MPFRKDYVVDDIDIEVHSGMIGVNVPKTGWMVVCSR